MTATEVNEETRPGTEVAVTAPLGLSRRRTLTEKLLYAREMAASGLLPKAYQRQPSNILWALEYAEMLGIPAMAAITGIHVIDGKPTASAGLISGLVRRAGHKLRLKVAPDGQSATCMIIRSDDPEWVFEVTWTMAMAREAGLAGKENWRKYPTAMLKHRAVTACARDACEEALFGLHYTPEELGAIVDEDGDPLAPAGDGYGGEDDTRGEDEVAAPAQLRAIGTLLEQMGVTDPEEQQGVVNRLAGIVHNAQLPKVEATRIMRSLAACGRDPERLGALLNAAPADAEVVMDTDEPA